MAYVPSEKLSGVLSSASFGLWLERMLDGKIAIACKIPETVIKGIYRGASATFLIASIKVESVTMLCLGLWVDDERERPFKVAMPNCSEEDSALLIELLETRHATLHCLNELNHPALSAS